MSKKAYQKWFIQEQENDRAIGPHTLMEIQSLLVEGRIHGDSRVFQESENQSEYPTPVTVNELLKFESDPVYGLFKTLESVRKKPSSALFNLQHNRIPEGPQRNESSFTFPLIFVLLIFCAFFYFRTNSKIQTEPTTASIPAPTPLQKLTVSPRKIIEPAPKNSPETVAKVPEVKTSSSNLIIKNENRSSPQPTVRLFQQRPSSSDQSAYNEAKENARERRDLASENAAEHPAEPSHDPSSEKTENGQPTVAATPTAVHSGNGEEPPAIAPSPTHSLAE